MSELLSNTNSPPRIQLIILSRITLTNLLSQFYPLSKTLSIALGFYDEKKEYICCYFVVLIPKEIFISGQQHRS